MRERTPANACDLKVKHPTGLGKKILLCGGRGKTKKEKKRHHNTLNKLPVFFSADEIERD